MKAAKPNPATEATFAYEGLDRVIHERARLSILTSLLTHAGGLSFVELRQLCGLTDGNLARHLQVLEEDGMIRVSKEEGDGRAQTVVRVSAGGRKRFLDYLGVLERVIRDAAAVQEDGAAGHPMPRLLPTKA